MVWILILQKKIINEIEKKRIGKRKTLSDLKDWGISKAKILGMSNSDDLLR